MKLRRTLLWPFNPLYYVITWLRNALYDATVFKGTSYHFPLICVGNLSTGGTGKTPMVEYLIRLLKDEYSVATLSRGYKRNTKGFVLANDAVTSESIGDEPYQFYKNYKGTIQVAVDANRQHGISRLRELYPQPQVIILDDAFQHRKVRAGYTILLTTYTNLYANDWVLPAGDLREPRKGAKRTDCIVVTKCPPTISEVDKASIKRALNPLPHQEVFFSAITYADYVISETKRLLLRECANFVVLTGIANAKPLIEFLKSNNLIFEHIEYSDHYNYTEKDIGKIAHHELIITTEKDYVRLQKFDVLRTKLYYLPIEITLTDQTAFNTAIKRFISLF